MRFTNVTVMRRKNLGNYEHEEVTLSVAVSDGEDVSDVMLETREKIMQFLNGGEQVASVPYADLDLKVAEEKAKRAEEKAQKEKEKARKEKEKQKEKEKKQSEARVEKQKEKEKKQAEARSEKEEKKQKAKKFVKYDRNLDPHKDELLRILDAEIDGWRKDGDKRAKAKEVSELMAKEGIFIFDDKGQVTEEFRTTLLKGFEE